MINTKGINPNKLAKFVERYKEIESKQRDLDFHKGQFARDLRAEFPAGVGGDRAFENCLLNDFGALRSSVKEWLLRAAAAEVFTDADTWNRFGGYHTIRQTIGLPKAKQVAVLKAALQNKQPVRTVMIAQGHTQQTTIAARTASAGPLTKEPGATKTERLGVHADIGEVCRALHKLLGAIALATSLSAADRAKLKVSADVLNIVNMYR